MHGEVIRVIVEGSMDTLREYPATPPVPSPAPAAPGSGPTPNDTLVGGQPAIDVNLLTGAFPTALADALDRTLAHSAEVIALPDQDTSLVSAQAG